MAVEDFLRTYRQSMMNKQTINPLSASSNRITNPQLEIRQGQRHAPQSTSYGSAIPDWLGAKKSGAVSRYTQNKAKQTTDLAQDYIGKAAGQISVDEFGIPKDKMSDFSTYFNKQLGTVGDIGKTALAAEEAKAEWQRLQEMQELNAGFQINWTPGASSNNSGAKAVNLAMSAFQRGTPYVWGGNSLTKGVDCSGLVQQVYRQLGISLPRTTYEQAKSGKKVSLNNLLPGDLIFYNTGSQDPNGIGSLSHVAIYIGNGQIVDARNRKSGMKVGSINIMGGPVMAVRPW